MDDADNEIVDCLNRLGSDDDGYHMQQLCSEDIQDFIDLVYEVRIMRLCGTCYLRSPYVPRFCDLMRSQSRLEGSSLPSSTEISVLTKRAERVSIAESLDSQKKHGSYHQV